MTFTIEPPVTFSHTGQRAGNQDYVFPADERSRLFIVCDGIGGWDQGEVASRLVAEAVAGYAARHPTDCIREGYLTEALAGAYRDLSDYLRRNPLLSRLGTTLALVQLTSAGASVVHVGDSRVYHWRGGRILHKTRDHKYVQELVDEGIITREQALSHQRSNALSRCVGVGSRQEAYRMDKADITHIEDIQAGDCFFLCTDGVLEHLDDESLSRIFAQGTCPPQIVDQVLDQCREITRDNYSGCLVQIRQVSREKAKTAFQALEKNSW